MDRNSSKWIKIYIISAVIILGVCAFIAFLIDPLFQFRSRDHSYFINASYASPGIIKTADYDSLIIGSCEVANFDMSDWKDHYGGDPLKVSIGGLMPADSVALINLAADTGKPGEFYVCLDLPYFVSGSGVSRPELVSGDVLSRAKYLLGYETWFRFIPVDAGLVAYKSINGGVLTGKYDVRTSFDHIGYWADMHTFSAETVMAGHESADKDLIKVNKKNLDKTLTSGIDRYIDALPWESMEGHATFFLPPYSMLYWCDIQDEGYYDNYMRGKEYLISRLSEHDCEIYDFQTADYAMDLDHYANSAHFDAEGNAVMLEGFKTGEYRIDSPEDVSDARRRLDEMSARFRQDVLSRYQTGAEQDGFSLTSDIRSAAGQTR